MERIQGPINPSVYGENWEMGFSAEQEEIFSSSLENRTPFLQMLQEVPPLLPFKELGFQTLLKLQNFKNPWEIDELKMGEKILSLEPESCVTHDLMSVQNGKSGDLVRERRKRKRGKPLKSKEEVENQRKTHITVERNRRRQMNDHLNVLRSLIPSSHIQRGDQASIIGGAINFVKELEQLLHSLENPDGIFKSSAKNESSASSPSSAIAMASNSFKEGRIGDGITAENKSEATDIEVRVIQTHVNLKIQCERRPRQLVEAIVALEKLNLTVLHLNVTTSESTVLFSFNLKIEDDCKQRSADEIAGSVHQIFS